MPWKIFLFSRCNTGYVSCCCSRVQGLQPISDVCFYESQYRGAKSGGGGLDTRYTRIDQQCRIYVGVRGRIKLLGGTIIKADGEGYVAFDGHVICGGGGNFACTPVECKELYEVITR